MFLASVGHVAPNADVACYAVLQKPCVILINLHAFFGKSVVQLGSVFPDACAVYFRYWCAIFECDGPSLMFVLCGLVCVFGLGGACCSPFFVFFFVFEFL